MPLRAFGHLFGQVHGARQPRVVALHGWARRGSDFDQVLAGLDAVAFDLPGFGATPPPDVAVGSARYADAVAVALAAWTDPVVVVGHSFGGRVAVQLAATRPELVAGLVLTGVPLIRRSGGRRPPPGYRLVRWAHRVGLVSDERMERLKRSRGSADYRAATGVMRDVLVTVVNESYEDPLSRLRCPVRLVWGEADGEVPVEVARRALEVLTTAGADARLEVVPGVGHLVPVEAPAALRAAIEDLL
jgi:pimeloyl-ACP methyl ester carboxylesterase